MWQENGSSTTTIASSGPEGDTVTTYNISTTDIYDNKHISPPSFLGILNIIAGTAILINLPHIILISAMRVGSCTSARNFKYFVTFLAFTDLLLSTGRLSLDNTPAQEWMYDNHWLCVTTATILPALNVFQTTLLALASLERFIAACSGINYSTKLFVKAFPLILGLALLCCLLLYSVIAILFHDVGYSLQGASECQIASKSYPSLDLVSGMAGGLNLLAIITCYLMLFCKTSRISKSSAQAIRPSTSRRAARLNRTLGVLVVTKVLLWMPIIVFVILRTYQIRPEILIRVGSCCIYLCSIANPILYGITSAKYRRHLRMALLCEQASDSSSDISSRDRNSIQPAFSVSDSSLTLPQAAQTTR